MTWPVTDFDREHNPYLLDWVAIEGGDSILRQDPRKFLKLLERGFADFAKKFAARDRCISEFGFAVPDWQALQIIKKHSPGGVCEIGAGTGYWAHLLEKLDVEVRAYDTMEGIRQHGFRKVWTTVIPAKHIEALAIPQNSARTLLLCWPSYQDEWGTEALKLFGGSKVIYIGEWGGCTATESFHAELEDRWVQIEEYEIPQWAGIHDRLWVYERKH